MSSHHCHTTLACTNTTHPPLGLFSVWLHRALFVVFCVEQFFAAHGADALLVSARLAVVGTRLVHLTPTNSALRERLVVGVEPVLAGSERFVLAHLAAAALGGVSRSRFPWVRGDYLSQLFLALVTHHC